MTEFKSFMGDNFSDFINYRVMLNYSEDTYVFALKKLDEFLYEYYPEGKEFTVEMYSSFFSINRCNTFSSYSRFMSCLRQLAKYLNSRGIECYSPGNIVTRKNTRYNPCILSDEMMGKLFKFIDGYKSPATSPSLSHIVYPVLFRLEYTCGLRPNEPLDLLVDDVDLSRGMLHIRKTKLHKSRRIMMSPDMLLLMNRYERRISKVAPKRRYFFINRNGDRVSVTQAGSFIIKARKAIGDDDILSFRSYDFRHNFGTRSIMKMMMHGVDPYAYIAKLSAYMGHSNFTNTFYYISLIPDHLIISEGIDWEYANGALEGVELE